MFKVLINDHEQDVCECLKNLFEAHQYQVRIVHEPEKVMQILTEFKPDILLMNYHYSSQSTMDGLSLLATVRKKYSNQQLPVIVASGHCQLETINHFMRLGIHDFVSKPVAPDYVLKIVEKCLN